MSEKIVHNNIPIEISELSESAKDDLARSLAFQRDQAIGHLAVLGYPADHPYEPKVIEEKQRIEAEPIVETSLKGMTLGH